MTIARFLVSERYDNLSDVPRLDEPLFLIHGTADKTVPINEQRILVQAADGAHNPGRWFRVAGTSHHPDGAIIAGILEVIDDRLEHPDRPSKTLPAGIGTGPFAP